MLWAPLLALVAGCGSAPIDPNVRFTHYEAKHMAGRLARVVVLAQDPDANRCVRILVVSSSYDFISHLDIDLDVPGAVENAEITDDVADCDFVGGDVPPPPRGASAQAIAGSGGIEQRSEHGDDYFGVVDIHATLSFETDGAGDFPPIGVALDADGLRMPSP